MSDLHFARAMARVQRMSPRKLRNHKATCWCDGLGFPHRIGSRASAEFAQVHNTNGCYHARQETRQ